MFAEECASLAADMALYQTWLSEAARGAGDAVEARRLKDRAVWPVVNMAQWRRCQDGSRTAWLAGTRLIFEASALLHEFWLYAEFPHIPNDKGGLS
jgi:hypothetical protein